MMIKVLGFDNIKFVISLEFTSGTLHIHYSIFAIIMCYFIKMMKQLEIFKVSW